PGRNDDELRESAVRVLAEDPVLRAHRLLAGTAPLALAARPRWVHHDAVALPYAGHTGADRVDYASHVGPADVRHCRLDADAAADPQVQVVERRRRDLEPDLARAGSRHGNLVDPYDLRTTVLGEQGSFHAFHGSSSSRLPSLACAAPAADFPGA